MVLFRTGGRRKICQLEDLESLSRQVGKLRLGTFPAARIQVVY